MRFAMVLGGMVLALAACGGKILEDPTARATSSSSSSSGGSSGGISPTPAPTDPPAPSLPPTSTSTPATPPPLGLLSVDDACRAVCERNGKCSSPDLDCFEKCVADTQGACGAAAAGYYQCYGTYLEEGCSPLPPRCEDAYCAYTACAGIVRPAYCF